MGEGLGSGLRFGMVEAVKIEWDGEAMLLRASRGTGTIRELAPGFIVASYDGLATESMVAPVIRILDRRVAEGCRITIAVDASNLASYETGYRKGWSEWVSANRSQVDSILILFRSNLVRMGISVVNMLTNGVIQAYATRRSYEAAVESVRRRYEAVGNSPDHG